MIAAQEQKLPLSLVGEFLAGAPVLFHRPLDRNSKAKGHSELSSPHSNKGVCAHVIPAALRSVILRAFKVKISPHGKIYIFEIPRVRGE
jgi:hypothetical protein